MTYKEYECTCEYCGSNLFDYDNIEVAHYDELGNFKYVELVTVRKCLYCNATKFIDIDLE